MPGATTTTSSTTAASIKDDVENVGGTYVNQEVCINGNVTTSGTPEDLPAFVVALMEMMRKG